MNANIYLVTALLCWGCWGIFDKKALEQASAQSVIVMQYVFGIIQIPMIIVVLNTIEPGWHLGREMLFWTFLAAIAHVISTFAYITAMSKSEASYVLGTTAFYPVISIGLATLFLGEKLILLRLIGAAITCLGVFAIAAPKQRKNSVGPELTKSVTTCLGLATLGWAIWSIIDKRALSVGSPLEVWLGGSVWNLIMLPIILQMFRRQGQQIDVFQKRTILFCGMSAICIGLGAWAYLSAMSCCCASYVVAITACYPVPMYFLAVVFLREQFSRMRLAGISLVVLGGVLVQNTQPL